MTTYPPAPRGDDVDQLHGHEVPDPFRALEDPDTAVSRAWSSAQEELFQQHRARWTHRSGLAERLTELFATGAVGAPVWRGATRFHTRRDPDQEHAVLLATGPDGAERVLVDPAGVDPSGTTTLDAWSPSTEGDRLVYQLSHGGREESVLYVVDVATGAHLDDPIDRARYSPIGWLPGGDRFYYVRRVAPELLPAGEEQYHRRVMLHRVGTPTTDDVEIFGAGRAITSYYGAEVSRDGRWLTVAAREGTAPRTDLWIADLDGGDPAAPELREVLVGADARASLRVLRDGRAVVHTDLDAARGRLAVVDPSTPQPEHWVDLVAEDPEAVLDDYAVLDGPGLTEPLLLVSWSRHALAEVTVHDLGSGQRRGRLELPGAGTLGGLHERPEGGHEAWFLYTDDATPPQVLHYDASADDGATGVVTTWAEPPGAVDASDLRSEQLRYRSADGTVVHMVALSGAEATSRTPRPLVLTGYGGFSNAKSPVYSAAATAWVRAGGVWVTAGLRGGSEEGEAWHRAGMREHKQNVFDDFHAAAEALVDQGWTTSEQLGILGGSNGGLLVGAALTQRPQAYRAVVCSAPLLDMIRYEQFGLGATWNDEYGTVADATELGWLLGYSPYHHVHADTAYPATLFTIFDGDTRVDPMHARKMAAAMQEATVADRNSHPVLVRSEGGVGHGARSVTRTVGLSADQLAFLAHHLGL